MVSTPIEPYLRGRFTMTPVALPSSGSRQVSRSFRIQRTRVAFFAACIGAAAATIGRQAFVPAWRFGAGIAAASAVASIPIEHAVALGGYIPPDDSGSKFAKPPWADLDPLVQVAIPIVISLLFALIGPSLLGQKNFVDGKIFQEEQAKIKEAALEKLQPGDVARIVGLAKAPEFNGQEVAVVDFNVEARRWQVIMKNGEQRNLKPENLELKLDEFGERLRSAVADVEISEDVKEMRREFKKENPSRPNLFEDGARI